MSVRPATRLLEALALATVALASGVFASGQVWFGGDAIACDDEGVAATDVDGASRQEPRRKLHARSSPP